MKLTNEVSKDYYGPWRLVPCKYKKNILLSNNYYVHIVTFGSKVNY